MQVSVIPGLSCLYFMAFSVVVSAASIVEGAEPWVPFHGYHERRLYLGWGVTIPRCKGSFSPVRKNKTGQVLVSGRIILIQSDSYHFAPGVENMTSPLDNFSSQRMT